MYTPSPTFDRRRIALLLCFPFAFSLAFFVLTISGDQTELKLQNLGSISTCAAHLRAMTSDLELGEHGFLLTGAESALVPLEQAHANLPRQVRMCDALATGHSGAGQSGDVQRLVRSITTQIGVQEQRAAAAVDRYYKEGPEAARILVRSYESDGNAHDLRRSLDRLEAVLADIESNYLAQQRAVSRGNYVFFVIGTVALVYVMLRLHHHAMVYLQEFERAQLQLRNLNAALEEEVASRTDDLRAANDELQQFAYVASHDLQEPLRAITSFTQLLSLRYRGKLDADADEFIGYIVSASRRMTDLINGLLMLARLRRSSQSITPESFESVLRDVQADLAVQIRESGALIVHDPLPSLAVERVQITQLLQNLIANAIKYRRPGVAPQIHLSAERDRSHWTFHVRDNGRGFDPQYRDRIFGMFQRLPNRSGDIGTSPIEGSGIGLSVARKIVERHGGRIWADSGEDGSTFSFSLPLSLETTRLADDESGETIRAVGAAER